MSDVKLTIDGREVEVPAGTLLVYAAERAGVKIPVYCSHPKLKPAGACRVCLVEIEKMPKVQTACTTEARDGMVVHTDSPAAKAARRDILEFLLINHPLDCPICDKGGECTLQDFTLAHGPGVTRFPLDDKIHRRKHVPVAPFLVLDEERCILCQRCTRYEDEVTGERNIVLVERGSHMVVAPREEGDYPGYFAGNNTEICPVGAWTSETYRFRARPWDLVPKATVCTQCSLHCNVHADLRRGHLLRLRIRENAGVDGGWLCDRGRYGVATPEASDRLTKPLLNGQPVSWGEALAELARQLRGADRVGALGGGRLSDEEALLLQKLFRSVLRSNNLDWRTGAQGAAAPEAAGLKPAQVTDIEAADLVVLLDARPAEHAPVLDLRVRRAKRILDVGPVANGSPGNVQRIEWQPGAELPSEVRAQVAGAKQPLLIWGGQPESAAAAKELDLPTLIVGDQPNGRGAEAAGMLPDLLPGYRPLGDADVPWAPSEPGIDPRDCDVLYVAGAILAARPPAVKFLIVQDLFLTPTAQLADLVLPAAGAFEKKGTYTNLAGLRQVAPRVVPPPGEALPDGEIFARVATALGSELKLDEADLALLTPVWRSQPGLLAPDPAARARRLFAGDGTARHDPNLAGVNGR